MPLPVRSVSWPPRELESVTPVLGRWSAWWSGDPVALTRAYHGTATRPAVDRAAQYRGGVTGALARFWWGRPVGDLTQHHDQTHVPLAGDIARTSADLLFAEPPDITVPDPATQTRLEEVLEEHLLATLTGGAEQGAGLGGVYLRVGWDRTVADGAFVTAVPADEAWPEFWWGRLRAVTFWHVVAQDGVRVWRHLERHELDASGLGLVQHGLYQGTTDQLGRVIALADHPATAPLSTAVDEAGYVVEGRTPGLGVVYVPNTDPSVAKAWKHVPAGDGLGSSDYDGAESLLDNLDEVYASWMRDLRLAKARILLAQYMLDSNGPGKGATFNLDTEVFAPLKLASAEDGDAPITPVQFAIRYAEHLATAQEWTEKIVAAAGYSMATFGEHGDSEQTATEVVARQSRTLLTRGRKVRLWKPALRALVTKLLTVDAAVFGKPGKTDGLAIAFPDGVNESAAQLAQTALTLRTAQAASTKTLVQLVHPDWDEKKVDAEVTQIGSETPAALDPFTVTA